MSLDRVAWVDYAKGICLVAVVCLYAADYVRDADGLADAGWMQYWVDFARPFRMPDFFLIAGLFLARTIDRPWRDYLDKKVVHFAYFFALWTTIYFVADAALTSRMPSDRPLLVEYLRWYVDPYHMLWFIAMLPVYFLVTRLVRQVPWWIVLPLAAALQIMEPESGWRQIDRFGERYVYFYAGYALAPLAFELTDWAKRHRGRAVALLALWAVANEMLVLAQMHEQRGVSLVLGFAGATAVIVVAALLHGSRLTDWLRYLGQNSIIVFLAFYLALRAAGKLLQSSGLALDNGTRTLLIAVIAIAVPVAFHWAACRTPARFLFVRPGWARLASPGAPAVVRAAPLPQASPSASTP